MATAPVVKRLPKNRIECTVTFTPEETKRGEEQALARLGESITIPGFRAGKAPPEKMREKIDEQALFEEVIRVLLGPLFPSIVKEHSLQPILQPRVEAESRDPLTIKVTFVERPTVTVKKPDAIKIEKKETKVDAKDIDRMIDYLLKQFETGAEIDAPAEEGHRMTMDFTATDEGGKEIEGIRSVDYAVILGSKTLLPGFEDALKGLKKGEEKSFTLTFPAKYHAEQLQGKPATFAVKVKKVEVISRPTLTDEFVKQQYGAGSAAEFRSQVEASLRTEEENVEQRRREQQLLQAIEKATTVELAPELIDEEERSMFEEFVTELEKQNTTLNDWMKRSKKDAETVHKELREQAEKRLTVRFGLEELIKQKGITVSDDEVRSALESSLTSVPPEQQQSIRQRLQPGEDTFERLRWQRTVEKLIGQMLEV
ncbi:MAG: trigger factor [Candidatus Peregrinibacteria bacterium]|nr:trigger factor [Candidatus Peregrinibacteria bacterium]